MQIALQYLDQDQPMPLHLRGRGVLEEVAEGEQPKCPLMNRTTIGVVLDEREQKGKCQAEHMLLDPRILCCIPPVPPVHTLPIRAFVETDAADTQRGRASTADGPHHRPLPARERVHRRVEPTHR
jgi:hypothetical protein